MMGGVVLALPSLESAPDPLKPWGLWIGTATRRLVPSQKVGHFLDMSVKTTHGCGGTTEVEGVFDWQPKDFRRHPSWEVSPRRLVIAVAGTALQKAELRYSGAGRWLPLRLFKRGHSTVMDVRIHSSGIVDRTRLRLFVENSQVAGFGICELTSPAVEEYAGDPAEETASNNAVGYLEQHRLIGPPGVHPFLPDDALVWMSVEGLQPDRASLDASGQVRRNQILLTCTANPPTPVGERHDPYYYSRRVFEDSSCGSVQTFRDPGADGSLSRRVFLAGILLSLGVALLIEAAATGFTAKDPAQSA
jgi:hypothetical protein